MTKMQLETPLALTLLIVLTACSTVPSQQVLEVFAAKPQLEEAPYWMRRPCPRLKSLDRNKRGQAVLETEWQKHLKKYEDCRIKQAAHTKWIAERDAAITGKPLKPPTKGKKVRKKQPVTS